MKTNDFEQQWFSFFVPGKLYKPVKGAFLDSDEHPNPFMFVEFVSKKISPYGVDKIIWFAKLLYGDKITNVRFQSCPPTDCFKKL